MTATVPAPVKSETTRIAAREWIPIVALYVLGVAVYVLLASKQPMPMVTPDEWTYGGAARSLAGGDGLSVLGEPTSLKAALYVYLITPAWWLGSSLSAYTAAKAIGTALVCLTVIPTWWLARQFTGRWVALLPAVLVLAGTWMTSAASLLTENVSLPLSAAALTATVMALRRPGAPWIWWALGFSALATWARMQVGALFLVLLLAIVLDALLLEHRATWRSRLARHRPALIVLVILIGIAVVLAFAAGRSTLGFYDAVTDFSPSLGDVLKQIGRQWIALTVMVAIVPMALTVAAAATPAAWRDQDRLRPLLVVGLTTAVVFILQSAWFNAGVGAPHAIQRYVVYAVPLLLVTAVVVAEARIVPLRTAAIGMAAVALLGSATPAVAKVIEERAIYGVWLRFGDALGASAGAAIGVVGVVAVVSVLILLWRARPEVAAVGVATVTLVVLLVQSQAGWKWQLDLSRAFRAQYSSLTWLDDSTDRGVTRVFGFGNSPLSDGVGFFNRNVTQTLVPPDGYIGNTARGKQCDLNIGGDGTVQILPPCDPSPKQVWNNDPLLRLVFSNGRLVKQDRLLGQIFQMTGAPPRVEAGVILPCAPPTLSIARNGTQFGPPRPDEITCRSSLRASTFLSRPGTLVIRFRGGREMHRVQVGAGVVEIPPAGTTSVRVPLGKGPTQTEVPIDWTSAAGAPEIQSVVLEEAGQSARLY